MDWCCADDLADWATWVGETSGGGYRERCQRQIYTFGYLEQLLTAPLTIWSSLLFDMLMPESATDSRQ